MNGGRRVGGRVRVAAKPPLILNSSLFLDKEGRGVLVLRGVPKEGIRKLRVGDFFMGEEIVYIQRKPNLISIVTKNGSVFNAHEKPKVFNVFKKVKRPARRQEGNEQQPLKIVKSA
jgi:hypothetical protein